MYALKIIKILCLHIKFTSHRKERKKASKKEKIIYACMLTKSNTKLHVNRIVNRTLLDEMQKKNPQKQLETKLKRNSKICMDKRNRTKKLIFQVLLCFRKFSSHFIV